MILRCSRCNSKLGKKEILQNHGFCLNCERKKGIITEVNAKWKTIKR